MRTALLCRSFQVYFLLFISLCFCFGCSGGSSDTPIPAGPPRNNVPAAIEAKAQALINNLTAGGYEVSRGYFYLFGIDQCPVAISVMGNCYGNNAAAPYILHAVPPWPEEYLDQSTRYAFGKVADGYASIHRFDPREAVIILGNLPPIGRYFGYQTYLFTKKATIDYTDPTYLFLMAGGYTEMANMLFSVSPNPDRLTMFNSIGNSFNNTIIERQATVAFNQERAFITTPDQAMERNMKAALLAAGVPSANNIFVEPVSSDFRVGLTANADDYAGFIRYALPQDTDAGNQWRSNLPMVVLRVRDKNTARPVEPYPSVALDARSANPEAWLNTDLQNLVGAVKTDWGQGAAVSKNFLDAQITVDLVGPHCYLNHGADHGMNCLGDAQDTSYQISDPLSLDNNEVYAIVGTLQTETGNASYVNLSVYESSQLFGVLSIDDSKLVSTANRYSASAGNTDKFYVYYLTRDCSRNVLTSAGACFSITYELIPRTKKIKLVQRGYVRPGTTRGPDSTLILKPYVVILAGS